MRTTWSASAQWGKVCLAPAIEIAEQNSISMRGYAYKWKLATVGGSLLYGDLRNRTHNTWAIDWPTQCI